MIKNFILFIFSSVFFLNQLFAEAPKTLHLFAMSDYLPAEVIKSFEAQYNAKVKYDYFSNNEELLAKFQSGAKGYDVIIPSDYMIKALIEGGYLAEMDHKRIPHMKNIAKDFLNLPFDQKNKFTVPYTWGTTGFIYNSKLIKEPLLSWKQLFDPKYKSKISLLDDSREVLGAMLRLGGHSANSNSDKELKEAQSELLKLKSSVRLFSSDPKQHILSEDISIAQIYSGDAYQVSKKKPELKYVVPKEGATIWVDNLAIPKSAKNAELAHQFVNYMLDPSVSSKITNILGYSSPNSLASKQITDPTLRAQTIKNLKKYKLEFLADLGPSSEQFDRAWNEAKLN